MKNSYLYCFLFLYLFSSCGSDENSTDIDNNPMTAPERVLLLKERLIDDVVQFSYTFNPDSTLSETITYNNEGEPRHRVSYNYVGDNITSDIVSIATGEIIQSRRYYKQNATESLREGYDENGDLISSSNYLFDGNPCGFTDIISFDALGNALPNTRVEFIDENCSSRFYSKYQDDDEYLQWEYTRNDKFDASNSTILPFFGVERQNCVTKLVRRTSDGTVSTNLSYDAVFEYNEYNHPIKETRTYLDGDVLNYTFNYYE